MSSESSGQSQSDGQSSSESQSLATVSVTASCKVYLLALSNAISEVEKSEIRTVESVLHIIFKTMVQKVKGSE